MGLQGFEGFLSSKDALRKRARAFKPEDRAFSLSSRTSAAVSSASDGMALSILLYLIFTKYCREMSCWIVLCGS